MLVLGGGLTQDSQVNRKFDRDGLHYDFEAFATPINLDPKNNLVTFIQCKVRNVGSDTKSAVLGANFGDIASDINFDPAYSWFKEQRKALRGMPAQTSRRLSARLAGR